MVGMHTDVLIVGAGPSGLALANILARYGINFRIIDNDPGPTSESRAMLVHVRTLELLDKLEVAAQVMHQGMLLRGVNVMTRGKQKAYFPLINDPVDATPFPSPVSLPQRDMELLLSHSLALYGKQVEWKTRFVRLVHADDGVQTTMQRSDGTEEPISAQWLVGCDGGRSTVRHALGVGFQGGTYEQTAFLADVVLDPAYKRDQLTLNLSNYGFVGIGPLGNEQFRLFGALSPEYAARFDVRDEGQSVRREDIQRWFAEYFYLPNAITKVDWTAIYRIHRRLADSFRVGRCFLVGDSAHLHAPAGGQGMNLGIGDAFNLGWKLALVIRGEAAPSLLDSYEGERKPVARRILNGADRGFELEATKNPLVELFRIYLLPNLINLMRSFSIVRKNIYQLFAQTWIEYRGSIIVATGSARTRLRAGDRAPDGTLMAKPFTQQRLFDILRGADHHVLLFDGLRPNSPASQLEEALRSVLNRYKVVTNIHRIPSDNVLLHHRYGVSSACFFLIRPDGYIAYIGTSNDLADFKTYMDQLYIPVGS